MKKLKVVAKLIFGFIATSFLLFSFVKVFENFEYGYEIGYNCAQDDFCDLGDFTEGGFDYWESKSFFIEQGYEEGYKKGARDYIKDKSIYHFSVDLILSGLTDNGSFEWTSRKVKSELLECFEDFAVKIEVKEEK